MTQSEFLKLLERLAAAWDQGDGRRAADCFTADAVYTEPHDRQFYAGLEALYRFFGRLLAPSN